MSDASGLPVVNPRQVDFGSLGAGQDGPDRCGGDCALGQAADVDVALSGCARTRSVTRRRQVVRMRVSEQVRRQQALPVVQVRIDRVLALLKQELKEIDDDLSKRLRESPVWREQEELLRSVPGVGWLSCLSWARSLDQIAALVGVAPLARDSGKLRGTRTCWGGRANALYIRRGAGVRSMTACLRRARRRRWCSHVYAQAADDPGHGQEPTRWGMLTFNTVAGFRLSPE